MPRFLFVTNSKNTLAILEYSHCLPCHFFYFTFSFYTSAFNTYIVLLFIFIMCARKFQNVFSCAQFRNWVLSMRNHRHRHYIYKKLFSSYSIRMMINFMYIYICMYWVPLVHNRPEYIKSLYHKWNSLHGITLDDIRNVFLNSKIWCLLCSSVLIHHWNLSVVFFTLRHIEYIYIHISHILRGTLFDTLHHERITILEQIFENLCYFSSCLRICRLPMPRLAPRNGKSFLL